MYSSTATNDAIGPRWEGGVLSGEGGTLAMQDQSHGSDSIQGDVKCLLSANRIMLDGRSKLQATTNELI